MFSCKALPIAPNHAMLPQSALNLIALWLYLLVLVIHVSQKKGYIKSNSGFVAKQMKQHIHIFVYIL